MANLKLNNRTQLGQTSLTPNSNFYQIQTLDRIRLGNVNNYKNILMFNDDLVAVSTSLVSRTIDMKSNGDFRLTLMGNLVANSGNTGKALQSCVIQSSIDGTIWFDKNIPVNLFVDSDNTPIINDEFAVKNRYIRLKWINGDGSATRTVRMTAEMNINGLNDLA